MTPRRRLAWGSRSSALRAPRSWKEPVRWKLSSLQTMRAPLISLSGIDSGHGVTITPPLIRRRAALIADRLTGGSGIDLQGIAWAGTPGGFRPKTTDVSGYLFRASHAGAEQVRDDGAARARRTHQQRQGFRPGASARAPRAVPAAGPALLPPARRRAPVLFRRQRRHPPRELHPAPQFARGFPAAQRPSRDGAAAGRAALEVLEVPREPDEMIYPRRDRDPTAADDLAAREDPYNVKQASRIYFLPNLMTAG